MNQDNDDLFNDIDPEVNILQQYSLLKSAHSDTIR